MRPLSELSEGIATWNGGLGWKRQFRLTRDWLTFASLQWETASGSVALARSSQGIVTLERGPFASSKVVIRDLSSRRELGVFIADWREGGRLTLCSGREWSWRPESTSLSSWAFRDVRGKAVLQLFVTSMGLVPVGTVAVDPDSADLAELPLLVALSWYLLVHTVDDGALLVSVASRA